MADQTILYNEQMVGAGHPTKADTLNRLALVEHNTDGTHKTSPGHIDVTHPDYGAVLDGVTVNTTAVQAAIDACPAGGVIFIPPSASACLSGALTLKSGITIRGGGGNEYNNTKSVLKYTGTTGNFLSLNNGASVQDGVVVEDIIIDGNDTTGKILDLATWRSRIRRSTIKGGAAGSHGVYFHNGGSGNAVENMVKDCVIRNVGTGIMSTTGTSDGFITDNFIYGNNDYDIYIDSASGYLISGNHTYVYGGNPGKNASVYIDGQFYTFVNNYIESCALKNVDFNITSFGVIIAHNRIWTHTTNNSTALEISMGAGGLTFNCSHNTLYAASAITGSVGLSLVGGTVGQGNFVGNEISSTYDTVLDNNWGTSGELAGILKPVANHLDFTGDRVRFFTSLAAFASVPLEYITGYGIPEGAVTAYRGSLFASYNTNGGVNDRHNLFIKLTTSGNTGWRNVLHTAKIITEGTVAPTTSTWSVGDYVRNTDPSELGSGGSMYVILGWICTAAGTPGTWLECRTLTGN